MLCGVSRNYVFVQRSIRAVQLWQMTIGVFLRIDTGVSWLVTSTRQGTVWLYWCQVRDWIVGKWGIRISRILYSTCVNEGHVMSGNVNTLVENTWQVMKETLWWPLIGNSNMVLRQQTFLDACNVRAVPNDPSYFLFCLRLLSPCSLTRSAGNVRIVLTCSCFSSLPSSAPSSPCISLQCPSIVLLTFLLFPSRGRTITELYVLIF